VESRSRLRLAGINIHANHREVVADRCNGTFGAMQSNESGVVLERCAAFAAEAIKVGPTSESAVSLFFTVLI
jgi:hypothetical protein